MNNHSMRNIKKNTILGFSLTLLTFCTFAQNPLPGKKQEKPIVLQNCTLHIGNGTVIPMGQIVFDKGIIIYTGSVTKNFPANATVIDLSGKQVYPGLISANNALGLSEIESIAAVNDVIETGSINPNVRALVAYNTDSDVIPTVRGNGILITQATPEGGFLSGQSSIFNLDGWNWQDAVLKADDGIWINWPPLLSRSFSTETLTFETKKNEKRKEPLLELDKILNDALAYSTNKALTKNLKLEALIGLFDGSKVLYIRTDEAKEIIESVKFAKDHMIKKIVIVGANGARECIDFLKENNISVLLNGTHTVPARSDDAVYSVYSLPYYLHKAGIQTVISYGGLSWRTRNLAFLAGSAVAFGLEKEEALRMITLNPAKILGIDALVGSLEVGKQATLVISKGDLLDMKESKVEMAFINGKSVDLNDKQKNLYRKFSENIGK
jgi:imidazolonepropionase-like amidohydrolase